VALAAAVASPDAHAGEVPVVYVQPKPGVSISDQELMDFAAAHVPERAAIPKQVTVMPSLPVTGIGKIFKPALQQREIESTVRAEAAKVGASIGELWFERDPRLGQVVRVRSSARAAQLKAALERYAFKFEVLNSVAPQFAK
jgi:fatty-acyl-CoA synthase